MFLALGTLGACNSLRDALHVRGARHSRVMRGGSSPVCWWREYRGLVSEKTLLLLAEFLVGQKPRVAERAEFA